MDLRVLFFCGVCNAKNGVCKLWTLFLVFDEQRDGFGYMSSKTIKFLINTQQAKVWFVFNNEHDGFAGHASETITLPFPKP